MTSSKRIVRAALIVVAVLASVTTLIVGGGMMAGAMGLRNGKAQPAKPSATPLGLTFDQGEWTITTPPGWTRVNVTRDADAAKAVRYNGPKGEYFIVAIDPLGSDFSYDALWTYEVVGKGFRVVSQQACVTPDEACSRSDARYDGYLMWKTGSAPVQLGGHVWYFMFGHAKSTEIDAGVFKSIAESVRAK